MRARIYQPAKTATQSGRAKTHDWVLEYETVRRPRPDPLMGWSGAGDTQGQVRLAFETRAAAEAYALRQGLETQVEEPLAHVIRPKSYADNFAHKRKGLWTH
jgi:ETC complex I subunit conserved region